MQQRRFRPGDVLDDYCPRERRITDHAIVAMIEDHIKQTRCVVCDAEHEYKDGKVPPQRRKKAQAALFAQVLDGLQGPQPAARPAQQQDADLDPDDHFVDQADAEAVAEPVMAAASMAGVAVSASAAPVASPVPVQTAAVHTDSTNPDEELPVRDEGPVRRQLIRAALPRPEGHVPQPTRVMPDFTVRQPTNNRGPRHGRRRGGAGGGHQGQGAPGPMRFGRGGQGQGGGHGNGHGGGQGHGHGHGAQRPPGARNHGRRGGKPR